MTSRTGDKWFHNHCKLCKYFRLELQQGGGCLEICEFTGEQLIWRYGELIISDNCPLMEVEDDK